MLRQHYQITQKEYLGARCLKNYITKCGKYIHHVKAGIVITCKGISFITLLSVVLLPFFWLAFHVNEDDLPDSLD